MAVTSLHSQHNSSTSYNYTSEHGSNANFAYLQQSNPQNLQEWQRYTFVQVQLTGLPRDVKTLDIQENLKKFGNLTRILIFEKRHDDRGGRAEVRFQPPPTEAFWRTRIAFQSNRQTCLVRANLSNKQPRHFEVESPVRKGIKYSERIALQSRNLEFGVLVAQNKMMKMAERGDSNFPAKIILDLRRKEIMIVFPSQMSSENGEKMRSFRFSLALDDDLRIWKLPHHEYILHVSGVPWYSKQLQEAIPQTHDSQGKRWSEEDTWARQTDIVYHTADIQKIARQPLTLQKKLNCINIARWTTFKFTVVATTEFFSSEAIFLDALKDFNVRIKDGQDFQSVTCQRDLDKTTWELLGESSSDIESRSFLEQLSDVVLPYSVRYQLFVCISKGYISEYSITDEFLRQLSHLHEQKAKQILLYVDSEQERVWDPMTIFRDLKYHRPVRPKQLPDNCMEIRSATVTATSIIFNSPTVEVTNRIIRQYSNLATHFLRVRFEDDSYRGQSRIYPSANNKMVTIFRRVLRVLKNGIKLGSMHFEFLAWGNSQLRDHGVYFFARSGDVTPDTIRHAMGAFENERVIAKRAARMGQCFSTTRPVYMKVKPVTEVNLIDDIKTEDQKWTFTDGVGQISTLAVHIICTQLGIKGLRSAFQFRLGGCKGVLAHWPHLNKGIEVKIRASQHKFNSDARDLEIIKTSEFAQATLNRQIITCLSHLGVPNKVFLDKQDDTIRALNRALTDDAAALKALRDNIDPNGMTLSISELVRAGFRESGELFTNALMTLWRAWSLKYLKEKAKIPIPKSAFLLGIADEKQCLNGHQDYGNSAVQATAGIGNGVSKCKDLSGLPEIYVQISNPQSGEREVITGICVLARNPSLHRGDIRVVMAVDKQELKDLYDVIVMPTVGTRDLPSMCSGGDLDGDEYIIIWDRDLVPHVWNAEPFGYEPPPRRIADGAITTDHIIEFFYDYMQNDCLGRIAHAHLAAADFQDDGIQSSRCQKLAQLHSVAVDYPKTGAPALMERSLEPAEWPHFMEKPGASYKSYKVLGQLYDAVKRESFRPDYDTNFDARILNACTPSSSIMEAVKGLKQEYDYALQRIMAQHSIKTEFEVWSTFIMHHSKTSRDYKFHEEIGNLSKILKEEHFNVLVDIAGGKDFEHLAPVATAAYQYTYAQVHCARQEIASGHRLEGPDGMPFLSFPWLLQETLCEIANRAGPSTTLESMQSNVFSAVHVDEEGHVQIEVIDEPNGHHVIDTMPSNVLPDPACEDSQARKGFKNMESMELIYDAKDRASIAAQACTNEANVPFAAAMNTITSPDVRTGKNSSELPNLLSHHSPQPSNCNMTTLIDVSTGIQQPTLNSKSNFEDQDQANLVLADPSYGFKAEEPTKLSSPALVHDERISKWLYQVQNAEHLESTHDGHRANESRYIQDDGVQVGYEQQNPRGSREAEKGTQKLPRCSQMQMGDPANMTEDEIQALGLDQMELLD